MGKLVVPQPLGWVAYWERNRCIYCTTFEEDVWRVEASEPHYRHHAFYQSYMDIYALAFAHEEFATMAGDFLKKAIEAAAGPMSAMHFTDDQLGKDYPALYDYLACAIGPNGKPREGACLLVYARDGEVTCCVKDRGLKKAWYGRADSFKEALNELEARLRSP